MITAENGLFQLHTEHTAYLFRISETGHPVHLYYGSSPGVLTAEEAAAMDPSGPLPAGNAISFDQNHPDLTLETTLLEMSSRGKGDLREPSVAVRFADGCSTCSFLYLDYQILQGKAPYETLPGSHGLPENEHLCLRLKEAHSALILELHYYVYPEEDVICRSARLCNGGSGPVQVERLMSLLLDLPDSCWVMRTFTGAWAREMEQNDTPVLAGAHRVSSVCGFSSGRAGTLFLLSRPETTERAGLCYGFNLIYSGNHLASVEVNAVGQTRVVTGIHPDGFSWTLEPGESLEAPEAILTCSAQGHGLLSRSMQKFIRNHILPPQWRDRTRPVLLNSWEAFYFEYDEDRLLQLARRAADAGMELFVLDDGWFGRRNSAACSLGDWQANPEKLPGGLQAFAGKLRAMGLAFGLWVEPEMVSVDSDLYRTHPDWALAAPGREHAEGRNQRILDLANPAVQAHLLQTLTDLLHSAEISYLKWDCNRIFSDVYAPSLPAERQTETAHRYLLGLYAVLKELTRRFPDVLFEGCAAGGGRSDPGMLCYFPQFWASDNTDPVCRAEIQTGYSFGYPLCCTGCHVSASPNHQTLRATPLSTRFHTAFFGNLGYELDLLQLPERELAAIRVQTALYKTWRDVVQNGTFYRLSGSLPMWLCVSADRRRAAGLVFRRSAGPAAQMCLFRAEGLREDAVYQVTVAAGQDDRGQLQTAEHCRMSGAVLMHCGIRIGFPGPGYRGQEQQSGDFLTRLCMMEEIAE